MLSPYVINKRKQCDIGEIGMQKRVLRLLEKNITQIGYIYLAWQVKINLQKNEGQEIFAISTHEK